MLLRPPTPRSNPGAFIRPRGGAVASFLALLASTLLLTTCAASAPAKKGDNQTHAGVIAADQGYWEEAEFRWLKALAITQNNARALNDLAIRPERVGEFEAADRYYSRALKIATPAERSYIEQNYQQFAPILARISSSDAADDSAGSDPTAGSTSAAAVSMPREAADLPELTLADEQGEALPSGLKVLEVLIAVPDQGPNLAGYDRILVGNFVPAPDSETNLNDFAVRYLRRRITQRTFFETQDRLESAMEPELRQSDVFDTQAYWVRAAADVRAARILPRTTGMNTRTESSSVW